MGIQDRDYAREPTAYEVRSRLERIGFGPITAGITACCCFFFVFSLVDARVLRWMMLRPADVFEHGKVWQLITHVFLHGDFWHILINMLMFWWAGQELERIYRRFDYAGLLLGSALAAAILHALMAYARRSATDVFDPTLTPALGASGMVMGVLVTFTCYHPRTPTIYFGLPLVFVTIVFVIWDLARGMGEPDGVAHFAHLGGAAFGFAFWYFRLMPSRIFSRGAKSGRAARPRGAPRGELVRPPIKFNRDRDLPEPDEAEAAFRERVDQVLAKISATGRESLSAEENQLLEEAARRFKGR